MKNKFKNKEVVDGMSLNVCEIEYNSINFPNNEPAMEVAICEANIKPIQVLKKYTKNAKLRIVKNWAVEITFAHPDGILYRAYWHLCSSYNESTANLPFMKIPKTKKSMEVNPVIPLVLRACGVSEWNDLIGAKVNIKHIVDRDYNIRGFSISPVNEMNGRWFYPGFYSISPATIDSSADEIDNPEQADVTMPNISLSSDFDDDNPVHDESDIHTPSVYSMSEIFAIDDIDEESTTADVFVWLRYPMRNVMDDVGLIVANSEDEANEILKQFNGSLDEQEGVKVTIVDKFSNMIINSSKTDEILKPYLYKLMYGRSSSSLYRGIIYAIDEIHAVDSVENNSKLLMEYLKSNNHKFDPANVRFELMGELHALDEENILFIEEK